MSGDAGGEERHGEEQTDVGGEGRGDPNKRSMSPAGMTAAEKAGQLTQYFYFGFHGDGHRLSAWTSSSQPAMVEAALGRGEAGSLLFVTDPAEINRLQRLAIEGNRLGIPVLFGFDVIHGLRTIFRCRSRWRPPGTRRRSSEVSPSPP